MKDKLIPENKKILREYCFHVLGGTDRSRVALAIQQATERATAKRCAEIAEANRGSIGSASRILRLIHKEFGLEEEGS